MSSYDLNYTIQNQRQLYPNYIPGLNAIPVQVPNAINNSTGNTHQFILTLPIKTNYNVQGYNPANVIPSQINPIHQILVPKSSITTSPPIQNINVTQSQMIIKASPNIKYNQSKMVNINTNLVNTNQNQIPIRNNINIPYNLSIISNQNVIQGKSNQVIPLYEPYQSKPNPNRNIINQENKLTQNKFKNELTNKNCKVQTERENEISNGHPAIPMELANKAMESICKISYIYNNEQKFGTGFFMKFSDSLKLLITNYHVLNPKLMNIKIQIEF